MSRHLSGFKAWLIQRLTAVYLGFFTLYGIFYGLFNAPFHFEEWSKWVLSTPVLITLLLLILFTLIHAWIGIRDILIDYIPLTGLRLFFMSLFGLLILGCGIWGFQILLLAKLASIT